MKKISRIIAVLLMAACMMLMLCGCEAAERGGVAMELTVTIAARVLEAVLVIMGAWVLGKLGKHAELSNIREALENVIDTAVLTTGELQQTIVNRMKEGNGGKLTRDDIEWLQEELIQKTIEKLGAPVIQLIEASGMDLEAIIHGAAEDWLADRKNAYWNRWSNEYGMTAMEADPDNEADEDPEIIREEWPEEETEEPGEDPAE